MQEQVHALEAQNRNLQSLVSELLLTNQHLRAEVASLKEQKLPTATATHPPPPQDRSTAGS